jgi:hypothetical protein
MTGRFTKVLCGQTLRIDAPDMNRPAGLSSLSKRGFAFSFADQFKQPGKTESETQSKQGTDQQNAKSRRTAPLLWRRCAAQYPGKRFVQLLPFPGVARS